MPSSIRKQVAVFGTLGVIAVCVGIAAHPGGSLSAMSAGLGTPGFVIAQSLLWLGVAADAMVLSLLAYALWPGSLRKGRPGREARRRPRSAHWAIKLAALIVALAPLAIAVAWLVLHRSPVPLSSTVPPGVAGVPSGGGAGIPAGGSQSTDMGWIGLAIAASVVVALGAWVWARRPRLGLVRSPLAHRAELERALGASLEDLRSIPDPRAAVIAAYASMENAFDRVGLSRRPFEAPLEFVARLLSSISRTAADARRLADLFELAKFSLHEIDEQMRTSAIDSLSRIRNELRAGRAA